MTEMKILLYYPSHRDVNAPLIPKPTWVDTSICPPLGLLYIASSLKKNGFDDVRIIDGQTMNNEEEIFLNMVKSYRPDCVGISVFTLTAFKAARIARAVKEIDPSTHITFGGPHIRIYPMETLSLPCVDSIVLDEGEISYPQLVTSLGEGNLPYGVAGVCFKDGGKIVTNKKSEPVRDIDSLPFPDRTLLDIESYYIASNRVELSTALISSRGCPYDCIFCLTPHKLYRQRSPVNIVEEMEECTDMGIRIFNFMDDVFNLTKKRVMDISREILRKRLNVEWTFIGRVDIIDWEMLEAAKESGLARIYFGIESGSDETLNFLQKGFTLSEAKEAVKACKELEIPVCGLFILGAPQETIVQIEDTIRLAIDLDVDYAQFFPLISAPGTKLYDMALKSGGIVGDYFRDYAMNPKAPPEIRYWGTSLSHDDILRVTRSAYRRFYLRPEYLFKTLLGVSSVKDLWRWGKAGLSTLRFAMKYS